ncbi:copper resistance CopC/CopD family protein [Streptomyces sp. NPDC003635]
MLLAALLVLLVLGGAGTASAHAALRGTDPDDGAVLRTAPRHLTLTFTESVGLLDDSVRVLGPDGRRLELDDADHADSAATARVSMPSRMAEGTYTVAWRVVSADSHPVSGAFTFSVGKPSATPVAVDTGPAENPATAALHKIARYLAYLAACLLIGTAAFIVVCRPPEPEALRRPLLVGWWTLLATTVALLVLRAPYESGEGPAAALDGEAFERTLTGRPGLALLARAALLLLAVPVLTRLGSSAKGHWRRTAPPALLGTALALTWAASDHASAGIQVPVAIASTTLHLLATAIWLGGLIALLITLYRAKPTPATVDRFSRLALTSVTVLVITGTYQSWRGLGAWDTLTGTTYGRLLILKLAAVALLLAAAAVSRRWRARRPLRRSVLAEVATGVVVLVITTVLTSTLPGRAAAEAKEPAPPAGGTVSVTVPFDVGTPGGTGKVELTLDPGRVGDNSLQAVVLGPDGGLSAVPELRVTFTLPAQDVGPLDAELKDQGGYWANSFVNLPLAGTWTMRITVRTSEIDQVSMERRVQVR